MRFLRSFVVILFPMKNPPRRILLIKPSSMGDVIHALPVAAAIHEAWPSAEIRWLIHPAFQELLEGHPGLGAPILFPRENFRGVAGWIRSLFWARTLRAWKPDLAIDLQGLLRSGLMARCSGARCVVGLSDGREGASFFYSEAAKVNKKDHAVKRYLAVLDLLGIPAKKPEFILPQGKLPENFSCAECSLHSKTSENRFLQPSTNHQPSTTNRFVVLHPYARGAGKNLTQAQVSAFASALEGVPVVLVGRGERMHDLPANVIDWSGRTTLLELIGILRRASFIVSSDSGPMHLAAALQPAKTVAIHRWSDPLRVGPWAKESLVWKNGKMGHVNELTEEFRAPGKTPTLEEMREIGKTFLERFEK